jgi:UDP-2-acetamido-3-amino-2,3-dideoxy-glucuronate N-acetyltransferase
MIHPLAVVHDDCTIGKGTRIWQFASVLRGAVLGEDCNVASGACFDGSVAGDRCILAHNVAIGPGFKLGNDVFIGPNAVLCNDAWPRAHKDGFDASQFDGKRWAVIIDDGASVGAGAVILPGVHIGAGAMVGAGVVCGHDVPPGMLMLSNNMCAPVGTEHQKVRMRFAGERIRPSTVQLRG